MTDDIAENPTGSYDDEEDAQPNFDPPFGWIGLLIGLVLSSFFGIAAIVLFSYFIGSRPVDLRDLTLESKNIIDEFLVNNRIPPSAIKGGEPALIVNSNYHLNTFQYEIELPSGIEMEQFLAYLGNKLMKINISVSDMPSDLDDGGLRLSFDGHEFGRVMVDPISVPITPAMMPTKDVPEIDARVDTLQMANGMEPLRIPSPAAPVVQTVEKVPSEVIENKPRPRIAIIIDDGGYGGKLTDTILGLDSNLTLAILPYTPYGSSIAKDAAARGFEVMLHMPMENHNSTMVHEGQLNVGMGPDEIRRLTEEALRQIPEAVGVNNHTGSKYTEVDTALKHFMDVIDDTELYFVDSRTSPKTIALKVARSFDIPSKQRDLFIDHDDDKESIRRRFRQAMDIALENGEAIAIGHFRNNTAELLVELLPELEKNGIELVPASELIQ